MNIQPRPLDRTLAGFATFQLARAGLVLVEGVSKFSDLFREKMEVPTFSSVMVPPRPSGDEAMISF